MTSRTFGTRDIVKTMDLAKDNGIKIYYANGLATTELPKGYLYQGLTGLTLDVSGMPLFRAWYVISLDVKELVDNKEQWTEE